MAAIFESIVDKAMSFVAVLAVSVFASGSTLEALEAKLKSAKPEAQMQVANDIQKEVLGLIQKDKIKTPADFGRASKLMARLEQFPIAQVSYELALCGMVGGDTSSRDYLATTWDNFMMTMSRPRRIGVVNIEVPFGAERFRIAPTYKVLVNAWKDPKALAERAKGASDNQEMQTIVDADQKARSFSFDKAPTQEQMMEMIKGDTARLKRTKEIIESGDLKTGQDFYNAGLVCQHGVIFEDYALAHELAASAAMLGNANGAWLAGASYDRMLSNSGFPQRFATQYSGAIGGKFSLSRYDAQWINDTERVMIVKKTLKQALSRKFN